MTVTRMHRILTKLFPFELIDGGGRRPYLFRWHLWRGKRGRWYLHQFIASDWSLDLHDHPKAFLSIGLWGSYVEEYHHPDIPWFEYWPDFGRHRRHYFAPWVRWFPATHMHRLILEPGRTCWTLVRVGPAVRDWGFYTEHGWVPFAEYVESDYADTRIAKD